MFHRFALTTTAIAILAGGCATQADVNAMRRPPLPPKQVILADKGEPLHRGVAVYEITGAPEFTFFDGGAVITTRPTRSDVNRMLSDWLIEADMLAPDIRYARYLLTVDFRNLRGPNVIWFTDKDASASVHYELRDIRTHQIVFERTYQASFTARMPGVTEEMVRSALAGGVFGPAALDNSSAPPLWVSGPTMTDKVVGAVVGVSLAGGPLSASVNDMKDERPTRYLFAAIGLNSALTGAGVAWWHDTLSWNSSAALNEVPLRAYDSGVRGLDIGTLAAAGAYYSPGNLSDFEAGLIGAITGGGAGFVGAAPIGLAPEPRDSAETIGAFDGTRRRNQSVNYMMLQNFNRFLIGLSDAKLIRTREAVTCHDLNPDGVGAAMLLSTYNAVGWDCPVDMRARRKPAGSINSAGGSYAQGW